MQKLRQFDWLLIVGLGCLALVHPLLNISGLMDAIGRPLGPLLVTALVGAIWVATVVLSRVPAPLTTLALTGLAAGLAVLAISALVAPAFPGSPGPWIAHPIAVIAVLATNTLWGTLAGLVAAGLRRALGASGQAGER
jgi:hypothetical protein